MNRALKKLLGSWPTKPASRKPIAISFQTIVQSLRKLWATSDQALALSEALAHRSGCPPALWCWWPVSACWACTRASSSSRLETNSRSSRVMIAISTQSADELGERELPADQHPHHDPELDHEVGRGELESQRRGRRGALLEEALGDRDRRVAARGGGGPEAGGDGDRAKPGAAERALDPLARHPGLHDRARSRSRARAPTRRPTPSGTRPCSPSPTKFEHVRHRSPKPLIDIDSIYPRGVYARIAGMTTEQPAAPVRGYTASKDQLQRPPAAHRGPGARRRADGRGRPLLHRRPHTDRGRSRPHSTRSRSGCSTGTPTRAWWAPRASCGRSGRRELMAAVGRLMRRG